LHWAAVKGNAACIKRLIEAGADIATREKQGKTARDMAAELKSLAAFKRGLLDAGYDEDGRLQVGTLSPRNTNLAILVLPSLAFFLILNTLAILPWWSGLLLAFGEFFGMHHVISKVLLGVKGPHNSERITKSPYLCSIIVASIVWVSYVWLTRFIGEFGSCRFSLSLF
jgi:palmitoyltransferase ZDHHC13/17